MGRRKAHYDIRAKVEADADPIMRLTTMSREQRRALMLAMLEDRFQLGRVHTTRSASTMSAKERNPRNTTSSFSKREKIRRKPLSLRNRRSISLRFL